MPSHLSSVRSISHLVPKVRTRTNVRCCAASVLPGKSRSFTTSRPVGAAMATTQMPKNIMKQMPTQQGMRSRMKNISANEIPNDMGLLPGTFIRPANRTLPKLFSANWGKRLQIELLYIKLRAQYFFSLFYYLRFNQPKIPGSKKKDKKPLFLRERPSIARSFHKEFYTALAAADTTTLNKIACKGLLQDSQLRIAQQKDSVPRRFSIVKYLGITYPRWLHWPLLTILPFHSTKVISDRIAALPFGKGNILRQMIVRIRSRQSLERADGTGPKTGDLTEYVVIQRMRVDGNDDGWKIWGTTKPSTMAEIEAMMEGGSKSAGLLERMNAEGAKLMGN